MDKVIFTVTSGEQNLGTFQSALLAKTFADAVLDKFGGQPNLIVSIIKQTIKVPDPKPVKKEPVKEVKKEPKKDA